MNRRTFLQLASAAFVSSSLDPEELLWTPARNRIFVPSQSQLEFIASPMDFMYGIPYHQSNAGMGEWLGISRSDVVKDELIKLIQTLEDDKRSLT